jgi:hypothetical protein
MYLMYCFDIIKAIITLKYSNTELGVLHSKTDTSTRRVSRRGC